MSVGVGLVLVTHNDIGEQLVASAASILKQDMSHHMVVSIPADLEPQMLGKYADRVRDSMISQDSGQGVLVLTDIHGATPDNLARYFCSECDAGVVSGVNLPMLLRVLNYPAQSLQQLGETAVCGGTNGIRKDRE